jgi:hypothetical protein
MKKATGAAVGLIGSCSLLLTVPILAVGARTAPAS